MSALPPAEYAVLASGLVPGAMVEGYAPVYARALVLATELGLFDVRDEAFHLREIAPGVAVEVVDTCVKQFNQIANGQMEIELFYADQLVPTGELFRAMHKPVDPKCDLDAICAWIPAAPPAPMRHKAARSKAYAPTAAAIR